jgi:hypothetical protein
MRPGLWGSVARVASAAGWRITVDTMASESNAQVFQFWSFFHEPGSEAIDALSVLDWAQSRCPACGEMHR